MIKKIGLLLAGVFAIAGLSVLPVSASTGTGAETPVVTIDAEGRPTTVDEEFSEDIAGGEAEDSPVDEDALKAGNEISFSFNPTTGQVTFRGPDNILRYVLYAVDSKGNKRWLHGYYGRNSANDSTVFFTSYNTDRYSLTIYGYENDDDYYNDKNRVAVSNTIIFDYHKPSKRLAAPGKPSISLVNDAGHIYAKVDWNDVENASSYWIWMKKDNESSRSGYTVKKSETEYSIKYNDSWHMEKGHFYTFCAEAYPYNIQEYSQSESSEFSEMLIIDSNGNISIGSQPGEVNPSSVSLNKTAMRIEAGKKNSDLKATVLPENAKDKSVTWSSSNTSVATVNASGVVSAVAPGNTNITAKTVNGLSAVCVVSVYVNPSGISLDKTSATLYFGNSLTLNAVLKPANATEKTITWISSDPGIATVNGGLVKPTGAKAGIVTITAKTVNNLTAKCEVTVYADNNPSNIFADLKYGSWQYNAAKAVNDKGYMNGTGKLGDKIIFSPNTNMNRSQFVTALYSISGKPAVTYKQQFTDVNKSSWYALAVTWAADNGIVKGNPDGTFGINGKATREQMALMFYQYAKYKNYDVSVKETTSLDGFTDASMVDSWALTAVKWAVEREIISGKGNASDGFRIDPLKGATRIECAAMMNKFDQVYSKALKAEEEDLEEPIALPVEEIEDVPLPEDVPVPEDIKEDIGITDEIGEEESIAEN